jgi:hypothetical protein
MNATELLIGGLYRVLDLKGADESIDGRSWQDVAIMPL